MFPLVHSFGTEEWWEKCLCRTLSSQSWAELWPKENFIFIFITFFKSSSTVIPAIQLISVPAHINWYSTFLHIQLAMKYRDCLLQSVGLSGIYGTVGVVRSQSRDVLATCRELCCWWRYRVCGTTGLWAAFACAVVGPSVSRGKEWIFRDLKC